MTNNKGITLIALVITIIVLLILAGVSIAMLTGQNGILTRATEADTETEKAEVAERVNMELNAQYTNALAGKDFDEKTTIESNLGTAKDVCNVTVDQEAGIVKIEVNSSVGLTKNIGKVEKDGTSWKVTPVEANS